MGAVLCNDDTATSQCKSPSFLDYSDYCHPEFGINYSIYILPHFNGDEILLLAPGVCDDDVAACFCNGTHSRIPAAPGSPPGARHDCL